MKILYLIDTLEVGGSEKSLLEITSHYRHTEAILCHIYRGATLKAAYQQAGVPVLSINLDGRYAIRNAISQVTNVIKKLQPDLLHTTLFRADIIGRYVGRRLVIPVISSLVNESYSPLRQATLSSSGQLKLRCVQVVDAWSARWCEHFTANSVTIKTANARALGLALDKITVIYRGRNPEPFLQVGAQQVAATRQALGISNTASVILTVGRLLHRKGQAELIQAMPAILQRHPQARLLIAGEGGYGTELAALIDAMGLGHAVQLLGQRNDIPTLLQVAHIFAFPSHYEGYPGALVEAMMAGCPIVASDIPVHSEAITVDKTGCLFKVQDAAALSQSILWLLDHPHAAKTLGANAQRDALARFHIDQIAAQHEQLYQTIHTAGRAN